MGAVELSSLGCRLKEIRSKAHGNLNSNRSPRSLPAALSFCVPRPPVVATAGVALLQAGP